MRLTCPVFLSFLFSFFFFFQAEDGIRDTSVTGVQTCALPIFQIVFNLLQTLAGAGRKQVSCQTPVTQEIGRASCRERVEISVVAGAVKKKKRRKMKRH